MILLSVENLTLREQERRRGLFRQETRNRDLISEISFSVSKWKSFAIVGEEKSGKNPLVMALLKMHPIASGRIVFAEVDLTEIGDRHFRRLRRRIQPVFSDRFGQLVKEFTVDQMFQEVLQLWHGRESREAWQERVERVMIACGLPEATRALYPSELDAVERQQVALARALLTGADFLVCYQFTLGLDAVQEAELLNLLLHLREEFRLTLLIVTDDLAIAHQMSDDIGVLHRGKLVEAGPADSIVSRPEHDYTKRLVSCTI